MNELEYQEEWLSAYLDDELTEEQRQVVEQRLAIDPAAQATLEDLQRVRSMVAKLPSWAGPDLKFDVPTVLPGSDEAGEEFDSEDIDSDADELDNFEEVPRLIAGTEEPRVSTRAIEGRDSKSHSKLTVLGWGATAASVLLVAGIGYLFLPSASRQFAINERANAPTVAAKAAPQSLESKSDAANGFGSTEVGGLTDAGSVLAPTEATSSVAEDFARAMETGSPLAKKNQGGTEFSERADPAPNARRSDSRAQADSIADNSIGRFGDPKMQTDAGPGSPSLAEPSRGFGGAASATDLAIKNLPADAPRAAVLPPPAPLNARAMGAAEPTNVAAANQGELAKRNANPLSNFQYARSQSWMDEETQSTLLSSAQQNRADQIAFGNDALQRSSDQKRGDVAAESVMMAAIKPEVANSPEFFHEIVASNQLVEVDQSPMLNQFSAPGQTANSFVPGRLEAAGNIGPLTESANAPTSNSNMFSNRYQMATSNPPQGNSFVLFLNRNEANQILNQLQEKGQVSSQVWRVVKQPEPSALGLEASKPSSPAAQNAADKRTTGEPQDQKAESMTSDKVILLLNGPPN